MRPSFPSLALASLVAGWMFLPAAADAQFRYPGPYPYGGYRYGPESDLRIDVTPKEASVYVDGYFAGTVDEFDGTFQRLHVLPGEHEIVIYLDGYRSIRERLYLSPNATRKIVGILIGLSGDSPNRRRNRRPPVPAAGSPAGVRGAPRLPPPPPDRAGAAARPRETHGATLCDRVQPPAHDLIDGERGARRW